MEQEHIIVLDFGGQYTQLIARCIREQGVYAEILPYSASQYEICRNNLKGVILSGARTASTIQTQKCLPQICSTWAYRFWVSATACSFWFI